MVETGGCAGYKYVMGLVNEAEADDTVVERDGVKVFVDMKSTSCCRRDNRLCRRTRGSWFHLRKPKCNVELLLRQVVRLTSYAPVV